MNNDLITQIKQEARAAHRKYKTKIYSAVYFVLWIGAIIIGSVFYFNPETWSDLRPILLLLIIFFLSWAYVLMTRYALDIVDKKPISYRRIIDVLWVLPRAFLGFVICSAPFFIWNILLQRMNVWLEKTYESPLIFLPAFAIALISTYVFFKFFTSKFVHWSYFLIIDGKAGIIDAFKQSYLMITGKFGKSELLKKYNYAVMGYIGIGLYRFITDAFMYRALLKQ